MSELKPRITENGIDYILVGDYYIPDLKLPEEHRHWKVWTAAPGIFKGNPSSPIEHIDLDWGVMDISCRPERTGTGTIRHHHGADESCRGRDRGIKAYLSNGMGAAVQ